MIEWLAQGAPFPPVASALNEPNGLLAASQWISPQAIASAYTQGIFPWYGPDEPVLWWSPDPRMVLFTAEFKISRSLTKTLRAVAGSNHLTLRLNQAFSEVMRACATTPRPGQTGTWISEDMVACYTALHRAGQAHSIEVWRSTQLVAGLYGVALGRMFFGESMFSRERDGSKIALAALVALLAKEGVLLLDCQQRTAHLESLGGRTIPRNIFCQHVAHAVAQPALVWEKYVPLALNHLLKAD